MSETTSSGVSEGWLSESIPARLHRHREIFAGRVATQQGAEAQSYAELLGQSKALASHLEKTSAEAEFVIVFLNSGVDAVLGILAAMHGNRCAVAVASRQHLAAMVAQFPSAPIILRGDTLPIPVGLIDASRLTIDLAALPDMISTDADALEEPSPTSPAQVVLTSGSSGEPKAVLHSQCAIQNQVRNYSRYARITSADRIAVIAPLYTITGQLCLFTALLNGATACFYSIEDGGIDGFADWITMQKISVLHATPTIFRRLADLAHERNEVFNSLRLVRIGGEAITPTDVDAVCSMTRSDCTIYLGYGCSELGTITRLLVNHETSSTIDFTQGVPVGEPCDNITVTIQGPDGPHGGPLADGEPGEVVVASEYLSLGYWNDPAATDRAYFRNAEGIRSYRTGDLGILCDGKLYLRGRADRQVKIRGHRVELDAVEVQLSAIPGFGTVAVEALNVHSGNTTPTLQLHAFLAPEDQRLSDARALRLAAAAQVSAVIVPARFIILPALPYTENGKLDREALRQHASRNHPAEVLPPETELEAWLLGRWRALLHKDAMGTQDDFFELGGDSMTAVRIFHDIAEYTGRVFPVSVLLEAPTVAELARRVGDDASIPSLERLLVTLRPGGSKPPLFLVHDIGGNVLNYRRLAQELGDDQPVYALRSPALDCNPDTAAALPDSVGKLAALYIEVITAACGERPVALGGLSFGGKVAFEIARQLHAAHREVVFLGLLDTRLEMQDCRPDAGSRQAAARLRRCFYQIRRGWFHARRLATGSRESDYLQERMRKRRKKQRAATATATATAPNHPATKGASAELASSDPRDRLSLEQRAAAWHRKLGEKWQPRPSAVPVHYFAATEPSLRGPFDNMANWCFLCNQGLQVIHVPGNHISLLEDPNIVTLGSAMRERMSQESADRRRC